MLNEQLKLWAEDGSGLFTVSIVAAQVLEANVGLHVNIE